MSKAARAVRNSLEIKGGINGLKTILGVTFQEGAQQLEGITSWLNGFGWQEKTQVVVGTATELADWFAWGIDIIGQALLLIGLAHKVYKFVAPLFRKVPEVVE